MRCPSIEKNLPTTSDWKKLTRHQSTPSFQTSLAPKNVTTPQSEGEWQIVGKGRNKAQMTVSFLFGQSQMRKTTVGCEDGKNLWWLCQFGLQEESPKFKEKLGGIKE